MTSESAPAFALPPGVLRRLADAPRVYVVDNFAGPAEIEHILTRAADVDALHAQGIQTRQDKTGFSFEMPVEGDAVLESLTRRTYRIVGFANDSGSTLRFRRYLKGDAHPPHRDEYEIGGSLLMATALLYLTDAAAGGETYFPLAVPEPVSIQPVRGRLAVWFNYFPDGTVDPHSLHESLLLAEGEKTTLTNFIYSRPRV